MVFEQLLVLGSVRSISSNRLGRASGEAAFGVDAPRAFDTVTAVILLCERWSHSSGPGYRCLLMTEAASLSPIEPPFAGWAARIRPLA